MTILLPSDVLSRIKDTPISEPELHQLLHVRAQEITDGNVSKTWRKPSFTIDGVYHVVTEKSELERMNQPENTVDAKPVNELLEIKKQERSLQLTPEMCMPQNKPEFEQDTTLNPKSVEEEFLMIENRADETIPVNNLVHHRNFDNIYQEMHFAIHYVKMEKITSYINAESVFWWRQAM